MTTVDCVTRGNGVPRLSATAWGGGPAKLLGLVAAVASLAALGVAHADPLDDARQAQEWAAAAVTRAENAYASVIAELDDLRIAVASSVEEHNGAQLAFREAQAAERTATKRADRAAAVAKKARDDLSRVATGVYQQQGELAYVGMILNAKDKRGLADGIALARSALDSQAEIQVRAVETRDRAESAAQAAVDAANARREAAADAEAAVVAAKQAVDGQQRQLARLEAERDQALAALADARDTTVRRERERQADLAATEQREREQAATQEVTPASDPEPVVGSEPDQGQSDSEPQPEPEPQPQPEPAPAPVSGVDAVIAYAERQLGKPYGWGASGPDAFDCSGLTMMAWSMVGVSLPHWSVAQAWAVARVSYGQIQRGDLIFWSSDGSAEGVYHVGLYIGSGQMIHAPSPGNDVEVQNVFYWRQPAFYGRVG